MIVLDDLKISIDDKHMKSSQQYSDFGVIWRQNAPPPLFDAGSILGGGIF